MSFRSWFIPHTILQLINRQWWRGLHQWKSKWAEKQQWGQKSIASIAFKSCGFQLGHIEPGAVGLKIESVRGFQRARSGAVLPDTLCIFLFSTLDGSAWATGTRPAVPTHLHKIIRHGRQCSEKITPLAIQRSSVLSIVGLDCFFFDQNVSDSISLVMINGETCMLLVKTFAWQSR